MVQELLDLANHLKRPSLNTARDLFIKLHGKDSKKKVLIGVAIPISTEECTTLSSLGILREKKRCKNYQGYQPDSRHSCTCQMLNVPREAFMKHCDAL